MSANNSASDNTGSTEQTPDARTSVQNTDNAVSNEQIEFNKSLVTYFILLAFFIFGSVNSFA